MGRSRKNMFYEVEVKSKFGRPRKFTTHLAYAAVEAVHNYKEQHRTAEVWVEASKVENGKHLPVSDWKAFEKQYSLSNAEKAGADVKAFLSPHALMFCNLGGTVADLENIRQCLKGNSEYGIQDFVRLMIQSNAAPKDLLEIYNYFGKKVFREILMRCIDGQKLSREKVEHLASKRGKNEFKGSDKMEIVEYLLQ